MPLISLDKSSYLGALAPVSDPGMEYTHVAMLKIGPAEPAFKAYVKIYNPAPTNLLPVRGLINELVGYLLAERSGFDVPESAGLILLERDQLDKPPSWILKNTTYYAWWCQDVAVNSVKARFNISALIQGSSAWVTAMKLARSFLLANRNVHSIVAFDDLIANIDRNIGNMLVRDDHLTLIDHGMALTGNHWDIPQLDSAATYPNKVNDWLTPESSSLPFKSSVMSSHSLVSSAISTSLPTLTHWLNGMLDATESAAVIQFLSDRSNASGSKAASRLGLVI